MPGAYLSRAGTRLRVSLLSRGVRDCAIVSALRRTAGFGVGQYPRRRHSPTGFQRRLALGCHSDNDRVLVFLPSGDSAVVATGPQSASIPLSRPVGVCRHRWACVPIRGIWHRANPPRRFPGGVAATHRLSFLPAFADRPQLPAHACEQFLRLVRGSGGQQFLLRAVRLPVLSTCPSGFP